MKKGEYRPPPPPDNLDELRERLAEAEARIEALETALAAVVRALAYGNKYRALCREEIAWHLAYAAETLGIDLELNEEGD